MYSIVVELIFFFTNDNRKEQRFPSVIGNTRKDCDMLSSFLKIHFNGKS